MQTSRTQEQLKKQTLEEFKVFREELARQKAIEDDKLWELQSRQIHWQQETPPIKRLNLVKIVDKEGYFATKHGVSGSADKNPILSSQVFIKSGGLEELA